MNVLLCFSQNYTHFNIPYYCLVWPVTLNTSPCHAVYVRTDLKVDTKETETVKVRRFLQCCTESLQKINSDKIKEKKAAWQAERTGQRSRSNRKNNQNKKKKKKTMAVSGVRSEVLFTQLIRWVKSNRCRWRGGGTKGKGGAGCGPGEIRKTEEGEIKKRKWRMDWKWNSSFVLTLPDLWPWPLNWRKVQSYAKRSFYFINAVSFYR